MTKTPRNESFLNTGRINDATMENEDDKLKEVLDYYDNLPFRISYKKDFEEILFRHRLYWRIRTHPHRIKVALSAFYTF